MNGPSQFHCLLNFASTRFAHSLSSIFVKIARLVAVNFFTVLYTWYIRLRLTLTSQDPSTCTAENRVHRFIIGVAAIKQYTHIFMYVIKIVTLNGAHLMW